MTDDWMNQANTWIEIGYSCMNTDLLPKYQYHILDRCFRGASDIISCETTNVHSNTASLIQWCKQWSKEAVIAYAEAYGRLKETRDGKNPTHRMACESRDSNGKRLFTAEHEYPIKIVKTGVRDEGWTLEEAKNWLWKYSKVTIILNSENDKLIPWTDSMEIAATRYDQAGIEKVTHPRYLPEEFQWRTWSTDI